MTLEIKSCNLIITGVGGQGNVLSSKLIGEAFLNHGYYITIGETYGSSQRGGAVMSHIRISRQKQPSTLIPKGKTDIIMALEPVEAIRVLAQYGGEDTVTIANTRPYYPVDVNAGEAVYPKMAEIKKAIETLSKRAFYIDATGIAMKMGNPILTNMVMIGAFLEMLEETSISDSIRDVLSNKFNIKDNKINLKAIEVGKRCLRVERE